MTTTEATTPRFIHKCDACGQTVKSRSEEPPEGWAWVALYIGVIYGEPERGEFCTAECASEWAAAAVLKGWLR